MKLTVIEPFSVCFKKIPSAMTLIHFSCLLSVLLLLTSEAGSSKAHCDLKDGECLDENQVFVQLRSEVRDSKDSDHSVAAHPRWHWRRHNRRHHGYHPYGPIGTIWMVGMRSAQKRHDSWFSCQCKRCSWKCLPTAGCCIADVLSWGYFLTLSAQTTLRFSVLSELR